MAYIIRIINHVAVRDRDRQTVRDRTGERKKEKKKGGGGGGAERDGERRM